MFSGDATPLHFVNKQIILEAPASMRRWSAAPATPSGPCLTGNETSAAHGRFNLPVGS